jgi:hypothetical protein
MGKLQTVVTLPKRILLQGWSADRGGQNINGEYTFYYETIGTDQNFYLNLNKISPIGGIRDYQGILRPAIYSFDGNYWVHDSDDAGWRNPSTNPNILPFTGWVTQNGQGPAGTITILENISGKNNKISIKKQNLSTLKGAGFYPSEEIFYIFKSPVNNILANIFNYLQFEDYLEVLNIYYEGSFSGQVIPFGSDGSGWTDFDTFENRNNYVIPTNSLIVINLSSNKNITVGGGAIIQKYYSGKITLKKS